MAEAGPPVDPHPVGNSTDMDATRLLIMGIFIPSVLFLAAVSVYGFVKITRGMPKLAEEAGWKRIAWGVYRTGPWGGPYVEPPESDIQARASAARLTRRTRRVLLLVVGVELLAVVGGAWLAYAVGGSVIAGALTGLIAFALLIGLIWIVRAAVSLRHEIGLRHRN